MKTKSFVHRVATLIFIIFCFFLVSCQANKNNEGPYRYEPEESVLRGVLVVGLSYGRPGYGETPEIDEKEGWLGLHLDSPIDVIADKDDELYETHTGVKVVQLVDNKGIIAPKGNINSRVEVRGGLFSSHTGHHHTKVLMEVKDIRRIFDR